MKKWSKKKTEKEKKTHHREAEKALIRFAHLLPKQYLGANIIPSLSQAVSSPSQLLPPPRCLSDIYCSISVIWSSDPPCPLPARDVSVLILM